MGHLRNHDAVFIHHTIPAVLGETIRAIPACIPDSTTAAEILRIPFFFFFYHQLAQNMSF